MSLVACCVDGKRRREEEKKKGGGGEGVEQVLVSLFVCWLLDLT